MEFTSILDLKPSICKDAPRSAFYTDFNLNQVIDRISAEWREKVSSYYYYFPADEECEAYRREVYKDVKQEEVYAVCVQFLTHMAKWREAGARKAEVENDLQQYVWHIREIGFYCDALEELCAALQPLSLTSRGMLSFLEHLKGYLASDDYLAMQGAMAKLRKELLDFRVTIAYDKERIALTQSKAAGAYDEVLDKLFPPMSVSLKSPFAADPELTEFEEEIFKIFRKKHTAFFKEAESFYKAYTLYAKETMILFRSEIQFYLSFYHFERKMLSNGFAFAAPTASKEREMSAEGLYDLALACVNFVERKAVVSNDMVYHEGESFFVLTGPNQGGKTTFARSLGQLVYFAKMGLDVPARSANVPYFAHILTHFSVEESVETGRGKLKEELVRLKPMMDEKHTDAFVVINELFTTAANYDACIMGKKVLEHFIAGNCKGIYVTHLKELSESHEKVVSLKAMLDEHKVQNFKIVRSAAESVAYAVNQVSKYHLTYDQLKDRLQKRQEGEEA